MKKKYKASCYLVVQKDCLTPIQITFSVPKALENDKYKIYPIPDDDVEEALDLMNNLITKVDIKKEMYRLIEMVTTDIKPKRKKFRRTSSVKFQKDKEKAIRFVLDKGATISKAAKIYDLNPNSLKSWVSTARKEISPA